MQRIFLALAAMLALGSCIRMDEPDVFACTTDSDCADGERCRDGYECVPERCTEADDCSTNQGCRDGKCVAAECGTVETGSNCAGHYDCDTDLRLCRTTCSATVRCPFHYECSDAGTCEPFCTSADECMGYLCIDRKCSTSCNSLADCTEGYECSGQVCVRAGSSPTSPSSTIGKVCSSETECGSNHCCVASSGSMPRCSATTCTRKGAGNTCNFNVECQSGSCRTNRCQSDSGGSTGASCTMHADCASGDCCHGKCIAAEETCPGGDFGQSCRSMSDCALGLMCRGTAGGVSTGMCSKLCNASVLCKSPNALVPSTCIEETAGAGDGECHPFCSSTNTCDHPMARCLTKLNTEDELVQACVL